MLKLNDLFEDYDLAYNGFELYDYDKDNTKEVIKQFRISANMFYPFVQNDELCFLRLSPISERDLNNTKAELELLNYLNNNNIRVSKIIKTKDNQEVTIISYLDKEYIACAFKEVKGIALDDLFSEKYNEEIVDKYGETLGLFHKLMKDYKPVNQRYSLEKKLEILNDKLNKYVYDEEIIKAFKDIKQELLNIKRNNDNYGLIHFDMEKDNIYYSRRDGIGIIDFDDSFYSFFNMDLVRCLNELPKDMQEIFKNGYTKYMNIDKNISLKLMDRFIAINEYIEIVYTLSDNPKEMTDWLEEMIYYLSMRLIELKERII